jgi:hypothetical protein
MHSMGSGLRIENVDARLRIREVRSGCMAELPTPKQASALLLDGKWTWRDALAIIALLLAGLTALEQHGVIDLGGEPEVAEVQP